MAVSNALAHSAAFKKRPRDLSVFSCKREYVDLILVSVGRRARAQQASLQWRGCVEVGRRW